uniref:Hairy-related 1 n=1 Tax=Astyanax mexicanus TaxID=7994 RepID=W5K6R6_ASTMX
IFLGDIEKLHKTKNLKKRSNYILQFLLMIEKKRRDRINQRLDELRTLLLDNTLDSRLQNPKLEKAEILDSLYTAGFQDCISRLTGFIDCVEPSQRENFVQGLRHHLDSHSLRVPSNPWACGTPEPFSYTGNHQLYPNSFVLHHPHPYPSPPYSLSPPPSPCYSTTSPTYLTIPCHFPFPPSVSPLSSDSCSSTSPPSFSFATSTPILNLASAPKPPPSARPPTPHQSMDPAPVPALTTSSCPPQRTLRRALFQNQQQNMWRPW